VFVLWLNLFWCLFRSWFGGRLLVCLGFCFCESCLGWRGVCLECGAWVSGRAVSVFLWGFFFGLSCGFFCVVDSWFGLSFNFFTVWVSFSCCSEWKLFVFFDLVMV